MADLEERALRRDKRFLVRLVLALAIGVLGGGFLYAKLTGSEFAGCAARTFGGGEGEPSAPAPASPP